MKNEKKCRGHRVLVTDLLRGRLQDVEGWRRGGWMDGWMRIGTVGP